MNDKLNIVYVPVSSIKFAEYNPRKWSSENKENLRKSLEENGFVDPVILNSAPERMNILIGGNFRTGIARDLGYKEVPAIYLNIPDIEKEKKLNLQLNRVTGEWDFKLLSEFDPTLLDHIGFTSEELDDIFGLDDTPEEFDLTKELKKFNINKDRDSKG
jgi:ParB-like chromosome segregation protein Spo0J